MHTHNDDYPLVAYEAAVDHGAAPDTGEQNPPPTPEPHDPREPNDPGGQPPGIPPEQPAEPTPPGGPVPEWQQYGFQDPEAMWRSYRELQNHLAQTRSQQEPAEQQGPAMPPMGFGTYASEEELEQLYQRASTRGAQGIIDVAKQVLEYSDYYGDEVVDYYTSAWMQVQPRAATAALWAQQWEQQHQQIQQSIAPVQQHYTKTVVDAGEALVKAQAADWDQYAPRVGQAIMQNPSVRQQILAAQSAEQVATMLLQVRDMLWAADQRAAHQRQAQPTGGLPATPQNGAQNGQPQRDENGRFVASKGGTADRSTTERVEPESPRERTIRRMREIREREI